MSKPLEAQAAIVSGASSGIGRAIAVALAREGASLTVAARRAARLVELAEDLQEQYTAEVQVVPTDVRDSDAVDELVEDAVERHGELDIVVSNAGIGVFDPVEDVTDADFKAVIETNVNGAFYLTRAAIPALRATEGTLAFVGSYGGKYPFPAGPIYAGTKGWLRLFAHSLAGRLGDEGVAVSVVNPGGVRTPFETGGDVTQADRYEPGEAPEPAEVADCVVFACQRSDSAVITELDVFRRDQLADFG